MKKRFDILDTPIHNLKVLLRQPIGDNRGFLERMFCQDELRELLSPDKKIVQINHTLTIKKGTVRGLHFQNPPHCETKFVSCIRGSVYDVAVDLRQRSSTFLQHHAEILSAENQKTMVLPEGFAHGFQALTDDCEILYFSTAAFCPSAEGGVDVRDPRVAIIWPLLITEQSERDQQHPRLSENYRGIEV